MDSDPSTTSASAESKKLADERRALDQQKKALAAQRMRDVEKRKAAARKKKPKPKPKKKINL